jgi:uncharacterized membrane protein
MTDVPVQVIVAAFKDVDAASTALKSLEEAKKERLIDIEDAAVIVKDAQGKVTIRETADMRGGKGFTIGAITGGVVGLLAGPVGWAALGGGVIGGLAAKLKDGGFSDKKLQKLAEGLTPGSSALVAVIDHRWVADVERELQEQGADLAIEAVRDDIATQLKSGNDVAYTVADTGDAIYAARGTAPSETPASPAETPAEPAATQAEAAPAAAQAATPSEST